MGTKTNQMVNIDTFLYHLIMKKLLGSWL